MGKQEFIVSVSRSAVGPTATKRLEIDGRDIYDDSFAAEVRALARAVVGDTEPLVADSPEVDLDSSCDWCGSLVGEDCKSPTGHPMPLLSNGKRPHLQGCGRAGYHR